MAHTHGRTYKNPDNGIKVSKAEFLLAAWLSNPHPRTRENMLHYEQFLDGLYLSLPIGSKSFPEPNAYFRKIFHAMADEWGFEHTADKKEPDRIVVAVVSGYHRPRQLFRDLNKNWTGNTPVNKLAETHISPKHVRSKNVESRPGLVSSSRYGTGSCKTTENGKDQTEVMDRPTDTGHMAQQLGLSEKTMAILVENHFLSLADLEFLLIEDVNNLHLPLRDASVIKRHLMTAGGQTVPIDRAPLPPDYIEKAAARSEPPVLDSIRNSARRHARIPPGLYKVLLLGETGSGKSTLINYLANYFLYGSLDNLKIAVDTKHYRATERFRSTEQNLQDSTVSKTSDCTMYAFQLDQSVFYFIDTPGLSDTGGYHKDDSNTDRIMSSALNAGNLSGIVIVINGTIARATANLKNTVARLRAVPD